MKKSIFTVFVAVFVAVMGFSADTASAATPNYYYLPTTTYYQPNIVYPNNLYYQNSTLSEVELRNYLIQLIIQLQSQLANNNYYYGNTNGNIGNYVVGSPRSYNDRNNSRYDDEPEADTLSARNIDRYEAELRGEVDMNDYEDGEVFFVFGTDEDLIEDVDRDYDSYSDIRTKSDRLEKVRVNSRLNGSRSFQLDISGLDRNEDYFFRICVGYEDDRGHDTLTCGDVEDFTTDR